MSVGNTERVFIGGPEKTLQSGTGGGIYKSGEQPVPFIVLSLEEASTMLDVLYQNCEELQSKVCYNPPDRGFRTERNVNALGKRIAEFCDHAYTELEGMRVAPIYNPEV